MPEGVKTSKALIDGVLSPPAGQVVSKGYVLAVLSTEDRLACSKAYVLAVITEAVAAPAASRVNVTVNT